LVTNFFKAVGLTEGDIVPHKKTLQYLLSGLLTVKDHVVQQWGGLTSFTALDVEDFHA